MKICIATENNLVSEHFGHCEGFTIYEIENNSIKNKKFEKNPGHQPGFLPRYLKDLDINVIISGGMGGRAIQLFNHNGIKTITGASGNVDNAANEYIQGNLQSTNSVCNEHKHHDECGGH